MKYRSLPFMKIIAGVIFLIASLVGVYIKNYNEAHLNNPIAYGKWISLSLYLAGMFFLMPWQKKQ